MAKYIKKSFAPHIYQDWIHLFKQCSAEQRSELLLAITDYPNYEPTIDISIWDFIKSQLAVQYQTMENKSQTMSDNRNKSRPKSTEVDQSQPMTTEVDKCSQIEIETGIKNDEYKDIVNNISEIINEYTLFKAGFQNWVFPTEIKKIAAKHWSAETIREIEKQFSCQEYATETSIFDLFQTYPPKPKTTRFVKPTLEEVKAYCHERMNMVDAEKFMNYYESNGWKVGKNPMKDWKAAIRTWEKSTTTQQQQTVLRLSPRERQDMINKQKTEALLRELEKQGC